MTQYKSRATSLHALGLNCSEKPNNWIFNQIAILKDVLDVLANGALGLAEQLGQLLLVQPKSSRLQHHVNAGEAVFALVD